MRDMRPFTHSVIVILVVQLYFSFCEADFEPAAFALWNNASLPWTRRISGLQKATNIRDMSQNSILINCP